MFKVNVSQEDIDLGIKCSSRNCPVARAILRENHYIRNIMVLDNVAMDTDMGLVVRFQLPNEAKQFISSFDEGLPVAPFEFEMKPIVDKTLKEV